MLYKAKSVAALHVALAGLPNRTPVEADPETGISARTVGELRKVTAWSETFAIATPPQLDPSNPVRISKASIATRVSPKP